MHNEVILAGEIFENHSVAAIFGRKRLFAESPVAVDVTVVTFADKFSIAALIEC